MSYFTHRVSYRVANQVRYRIDNRTAGTIDWDLHIELRNFVRHYVGDAIKNPIKAKVAQRVCS